MTAADWAHQVRTLADHIHTASYDRGPTDRNLDAYYEALLEYERCLWLEDLAAHHSAEALEAPTTPELVAA